MISAFGIIITVAYDDALDRDTLFVFFSFSLSRSVSFAGSERDSTRVRILHSTTLRTKLIKPAIIYIYIFIYSAFRCYCSRKPWSYLFAGFNLREMIRIFPL